MRHRSTVSIVRFALTALIIVNASGCHTAAAPEPAKPTWAAGTKYLYGLHMTSDATTDPNASATLFDFDMTADLAVTPLDVTPDSTRLSFAFTNVKLTTRQDAQHKARFEQVVQQLQVPTTFTYVAGKQAAANLPKDAQAVTVGILRNVAAQFQFPASEQKLAQKSQAQEYDATGLYTVEYVRKADTGASGEESFARKKLSYSALIAGDLAHKQFANGATNPPKFVESTGEVTRKDSVFTKLRAHERLDLELMAGRGITSRTTIELDLVSQEKASPIDAALIASQTVALDAKAPYLHSSAAFDMDAAKIGGRSFDEVISALEGLARTQDSVRLVSKVNGKNKPAQEVQSAQKWTAGSLQHFIALAAMFRKNPDDIQRALAFVRGKSPATHAIISALGAAGTEASQVALLEIMRNDAFFKQDVRDIAGFSLLRVKTPTRASALALQAMLSEPKWREHAVFGLGTFVRRFGEAGQFGLMKEFGDVLVSELQRADDAAERIEVLTGMSNSGYAPALPLIREDLKSSDADVRAAAVQAVRLIQDPEVDGLIMTALLDMEAKQVRLGALEAIENRSYSPQLAAALSECLRVEPEARVRQHALELIVGWSAEQPALRTLIEQTAQKDQSDVIRKTAQSALAELKKP